MKKISFSKIVTATICLTMSMSFFGCKKKSIVLKLSDVLPDNYPTTLADKEFKRLVEERTEGRIQIEVYTDGKLYSDEPSQIEALKSGELAFARTSCSPVTAYVPKLNVIQLPYLYKNSEHMWKVLNGPIGQSILEEIETSGSGLMGLCYYDGGARSFYLIKEVHKPDDMTGLKIRVQNNAMMIRLCKLLGATGVVGIGPSEIYSSIKTGLIDGAENSIPIYESMGDYKAAQYYIVDQHTRFPEVILASAEIMRSLDPSDLEIIKQCAKETQDFEIKKWAEKEKQSEEIIRREGNIIIELSDEAKAEFRTRMKPIYDEYGYLYKDTISQILKLENQ